MQINLYIFEDLSVPRTFQVSFERRTVSNQYVYFLIRGDEEVFHTHIYLTTIYPIKHRNLVKILDHTSDNKDSTTTSTPTHILIISISTEDDQEVRPVKSIKP